MRNEHMPEELPRGQEKESRSYIRRVYEVVLRHLPGHKREKPAPEYHPHRKTCLFFEMP